MLGLSGIFYGCYQISQPHAYVITGGIVLILGIVGVIPKQQKEKE